MNFFYLIILRTSILKISKLTNSNAAGVYYLIILRTSILKISKLN